jgi:uncharacterized membrane protein YeaQ/YmgE (transglycosylase-associated protein family)
METLVWLVAGGLVGWLSYTYLHYNEARGLMVAIVIGAVGALLGVKWIAPMFLAATTAAAEPSLSLALFAAAAAAACLALGDLVHQRWGV